MRKTIWAIPRPDIASMKLSNPKPNNARLSSLYPKYVETSPSRIVLPFTNPDKDGLQGNGMLSTERIRSGRRPSERIWPPGTVHGTVRSGRPWRVGRADASATGPDVPAAGRIRRVPPARARVRPGAPRLACFSKQAWSGEVAEGGTALPPPVAGKGGATPREGKYAARTLSGFVNGSTQSDAASRSSPSMASAGIGMPSCIRSIQTAPSRRPG